MSNIREKLALGNAKRYYQVETEFEAVGTFYTNGQMMSNDNQTIH